MGQVYRARDTRLDRMVAVKVLSPALAESPEALARFEREAKAVAALSHTNIVALYDFGQAEGMLYAVTELLEGETLRARLAGGRLPPRKAIDVAAQIAEGLAAAHDRSIVHRDLKPENVFVTRSGAVKILDFGLARQNVLTAPSGMTNSPTVARATDPGTVLGTVGYMSPEQVRGQTADHRSDIFSFGSVLYEMLSGRRAFERESPAETMAAIAREDPKELSDPYIRLPAGLDRIVHHCLEKAPDERFQSARDLAFDLRALSSVSSSEKGPTSTLPAAALFRWRRVVAAAMLLVVGYALGSLGSRSSVPADRPSLRTRFTQVTDTPGLEVTPRLSPDGESLIYASDASGSFDIYTLRVGGHNAVNLTPDSKEDDWAPALSADGRQIAFRSERDGGGIFLMGATGESVRRLTDFGYDPTWSPDGRYLAVATEGVREPRSRIDVSELWVVSVADGSKRLLTKGDAVQPAWSPDGVRIAFVRFFGQKGASLWTIPAAGPVDADAAPVMNYDSMNFSPSWSTDGKLVYFSSDRGGPTNVWRVAIDPRTGRALGEPEPMTVPAVDARSTSLSSLGTRLAFETWTSRSRLRRVAFDAGRGLIAGTPQEFWSVSRDLLAPRLSPDGEWVALYRRAGGGSSEDLLVVKTDGSRYRQLTDDAATNRFPSFSPSGERIAFYSARQGSRSQIFEIHTDGSGFRQLGNLEERSLYYPIYSPDGSRIAAADESGGTWLLDLDKPSSGWTALHRRVTGEPLGDTVSSWSRDGKWIAGDLIDKSFRRLGIFVESVETGERRRLTTAGEWPRWLSDSRRILYLESGTIRLLDTVTGRESQILSEPAAWRLAGFDLARDERSLLLLEGAFESDIWMMTEESK